MPTHPDPESSAERSAETRSRILDAALREFSAHGLAGARTEQIAAAAGVNKALIYYYFESKEKLYLAALELAAGRVRDRADGGVFCATPARENGFCARLWTISTGF